MSGCTLPFNNPPAATPTAVPQPSDTTPGTVATQQPPATPTPKPAFWLDGYTEYKFGHEQNLANGMKSTIDKIYHNDDYTMPVPLGTGSSASHHGVIYRVKFYNPTTTKKTEQLGIDMKSMIFYFNSENMRKKFMTSDTFYNENTGEMYLDLDVAPGETKTVYILSYISRDRDYEANGSRIDWPPSMDTTSYLNF